MEELNLMSPEEKIKFLKTIGGDGRVIRTFKEQGDPSIKKEKEKKNKVDTRVDKSDLLKLNRIFNPTK